MRIVVALGGNALLRRDEEPTAGNQLINIAAAARALASVIRDHDVVLTHGNGPQIGLLALLYASAGAEKSQPLDVLGAETDGLLGHLLAQAFRTEIRGLDMAVLLTQVRVDPEDPAFADPTKPIGPVYDEDEAQRLATERDWVVGPDGSGWRRLVASPAPLELIELPAIRLLNEAGTLVVCAGGGGIPVARDADGRVSGLEAVVDKDATAALLATELEADALMLLTDVSAVMRDFGTVAESPIDEIGVTDALEMADALPGGSIGPKLRAAAEFARDTGGVGLIGALEEAEAVVAGEAGTRVGVWPRD